ncbi:MAG: DUF2568 domain-containing protein [Deltaproteobacteria bacterium]|nr:DUF2568 domain-containing protein [Deltaproteobacteria bacterium]
MGSHPANLVLRFVLELVALGTFGWWGLGVAHPVFRWVLMLALPILAAALWATFAVPNDPSRSGKTVVATPGWLRLIGELGFFAAAAGALAHRGETTFALVVASVVVVHYVLSYDRVAWLLRH